MGRYRRCWAHHVAIADPTSQPAEKPRRCLGAGVAGGLRMVISNNQQEGGARRFEIIARSRYAGSGCSRGAGPGQAGNLVMVVIAA